MEYKAPRLGRSGQILSIADVLGDWGGITQPWKDSRIYTTTLPAPHRLCLMQDPLYRKIYPGHMGYFYVRNGQALESRMLTASGPPLNHHTAFIGATQHRILPME
jgi:hypothetical protein